MLDVVFGLIFLADFCAGCLSAGTAARSGQPLTWVDAAAIASFLAPLVGESPASCGILRTLRLLRSYQLLARLCADFDTFRRHEDIIVASCEFRRIPVRYDRLRLRNPTCPQSGDPELVDALYFTVAALTTTGFGDITLPGTVGR